MPNDYHIFFSSESNEWATPQWLFDELDKEFHFTLDPCCTHENAKCKRHFTIEEETMTPEAKKLYDDIFYGRKQCDGIKCRRAKLEYCNNRHCAIECERMTRKKETRRRRFAYYRYVIISFDSRRRRYKSTWDNSEKKLILRSVIDIATS